MFRYFILRTEQQLFCYLYGVALALVLMVLFSPVSRAGGFYLVALSVALFWAGLALYTRHTDRMRRPEVSPQVSIRDGIQVVALSAAIIPERGACVAKKFWSYLCRVYGGHGHRRTSHAGRSVDVSGDGDSASQNGGAGDSFCGGAVMVTGIQLCTAERFVYAQDRECIKAEEGPVWHKY